MVKSHIGSHKNIKAHIHPDLWQRLQAKLLALNVSDSFVQCKPSLQLLSITHSHTHKRTHSRTQTHRVTERCLGSVTGCKQSSFSYIFYIYFSYITLLCIASFCPTPSPQGSLGQWHGPLRAKSLSHIDKRLLTARPKGTDTLLHGFLLPYAVIFLTLSPLSHFLLTLSLMYIVFAIFPFFFLA